MTTTFQELNAEIIQVLCHFILTLDQLVQFLTQKYPDSNWNSELVEQLMALGCQEGRFLQVSVDPQRWQIRRNMAFINPSNIVYQDLCPLIIKWYRGMN